MKYKRVRSHIIGFLSILLLFTSSNFSFSSTSYGAIAENQAWNSDAILPPGVTLDPENNQEPILDPPQIVEWEEPSVTDDAYTLADNLSAGFGIQSLTEESSEASLESSSLIEQEDRLPVPFVPEFLLSDKDVGELMLAGAGAYDRYQLHLLASQQAIHPLEIWQKKKKSGLSWQEWLPQSGLRLANTHSVSQNVYGLFPGDTLQDKNVFPSFPPATEPDTAEEDTYQLDTDLSASIMSVTPGEEATLNNFQRNIDSYLKLIAPLQINQIAKEQYADRQKTSESIDPATGALTWKFNALHYPGRDGLDMNLGLMYQSNQATSFLEANAPIPVIEYRNGTASFKYKNIARTEWSTTNYLFDTFQLGNGWSFQLPSLQIERPKYGQETYYYYHDGQGASYQVKFGSSATNLVNPPNTLTRFMRGGSFSNGQTSAAYYMEYPNKKLEYFNDQGQLIGVVDRFQNKLTYEYGGKPLQYIQITDTTNRKLRIEYQRGETENAVIVYSITPDGQKKSEVVMKSQPQKWTARDRGDTMRERNDYIQDVNPALRTLSYVNDDASGNRQYLWTTKFNYMDRARAEFSYTSRSWNTQEGVGAMAAFPLSEIEYPRSQTYYDYTRAVHNMGRDGLQQEYVVSQRADEPQKQDGSKRTNLVNQIQYTYSGDYTGFPQATSQENMPTGYTYEQQALTMEQGTQTFRTVNRFNYKGQKQDMLRYGADGQSSLTTFEAYDTNFKFNPVRSKEVLIDPSGQITRYTEQKYDTIGNLIQTTAPLTADQLANADIKQKRSTFYTYEPKYNQVQTESVYQNDSTQLTNTYAYTSDGRISVVRDPLGQESNTTYTKTASGAVSQTITEHPVRPGIKARTVTDYGADTGYVLPSAVSTYFRSASSGTQLQNTQSFRYDPRTSLLLEETNGEGQKTGYTYDALDRVLRVQKPKLTNTDGEVYNVADRYQYENGYVDRQDGSPVVAGLIVNTYQETSQKSNGKQVNLNEHIATYDGFGMTLTDSTIDRTNPALPTTKVIRYNTDARLRPVKQATAVYQGTTSSGMQLIEGPINNAVIAYDTWDQPTLTTDATGNKVKIQNLTAQFKKQLTFQTADGKVVNAVDQQYDQWGNLTKNIAYKGASDRSLPISEVYTYDIAGNVLTYTDPNATGNAQHPRNRAGVTQSYTYDKLNRPVQLLNALNQTTTYAYDGNNQLIQASIQDATNTAVIFNKDFNETSKLLSKTDPSNVSTQNQYDPMGRLKIAVDRKGTSSEYTYDEWGQVTSHILKPGTSDTSALSPSLSYRYTYGKGDIQTRQIRRDEGSSRSVEQQIRVDLLGRMTQEKGYTLDGTSDPLYGGNIDTSYNRLGQVASRQTSFQSSDVRVQGSLQQYTYDTKGQLTRMGISNNGSEQNIQYTYEPQGQVATITYPAMANGQVLKTQNNYIEFNRLYSSVTQLDQQLISQSYYKYDNNGNIIQLEETHNSKKLVQSQYYTYDALNRITGFQTSTGESVTYTYDLRGNRLIQTEDRPSIQEDVSETTNRYDAQNQLRQSSIVRTETDQGKTSKSELKVDFRYLPDGSRYEKKVVELKNGVNRVQKVQHAIADTNNKVIFEETTNYVADSSNPYVTKPSDPVYAEYIRSDRVLLKREIGKDSNTVYYYVYNGHGDVKSILDAQGNIVNTYDYDEFGNITAQKEQIQNPFKYAGEYLDEETGLYHLDKRYYDPSMGRFIQEDTVEGQINNPLSLNLYTYVENDPLNMVDPDGHSPQKPSRETPYGGGIPSPKGGNKGGGGGGITFGVVASIIAKVESAIRHKKIEYGQFFDSTGKKVGERIKGTENSIDLSPYKNIAENKIFTHNHPKNRTFSFQDIDTAIQYDMAEIRAVTPNGKTMSMKRKADAWKVSLPDLPRIFQETEKKLRNDPDIVALYRAGKYEEVDDILMRQIASKIGGQYHVQ